MEALTELYDQALLGILQHVGGVDEFLRVLFGFLYRKTDFYRLLLRPGDRLGFPPGAAQAMALQAFQVFERMARQDDERRHRELEAKLRKKEEEEEAAERETGAVPDEPRQLQRGRARELRLVPRLQRPGDQSAGAQAHRKGQTGVCGYQQRRDSRSGAGGQQPARPHGREAHAQDQHGEFPLEPGAGEVRFDQPEQRGRVLVERHPGGRGADRHRQDQQGALHGHGGRGGARRARPPHLRLPPEAAGQAAEPRAEGARDAEEGLGHRGLPLPRPEVRPLHVQHLPRRRAVLTPAKSGRATRRRERSNPPETRRGTRGLAPGAPKPLANGRAAHPHPSAPGHRHRPGSAFPCACGKCSFTPRHHGNPSGWDPSPRLASRWRRLCCFSGIDGARWVT
uniref:NudC N-terminal domain-containing protein n=1 Tax=Anser cygnoides TaxID=8845 RepID=A0A8B9EQC5_ANSCY